MVAGNLGKRRVRPKKLGLPIVEIPTTHCAWLLPSPSVLKSTIHKEFIVYR